MPTGGKAGGGERQRRGDQEDVKDGGGVGREGEGGKKRERERETKKRYALHTTRRTHRSWRNGIGHNNQSSALRPDRRFLLVISFPSSSPLSSDLRPVQ